MKKLKSLARKVAARKPRQSKRKKVAGDTRFVRESGPFNSLTTGEAFSLGNFEVAIFFRASLHWPTRSRLFSRMRPSHANHGTISSPPKSRIFVRGECPSLRLGQYPFAGDQPFQDLFGFQPVSVTLCSFRGGDICAVLATAGSGSPASATIAHGRVAWRAETALGGFGSGKVASTTAGYDTNRDINVMMASTALSC